MAPLSVLPYPTLSHRDGRNSGALNGNLMVITPAQHVSPFSSAAADPRQDHGGQMPSAPDHSSMVEPAVVPQSDPQISHVILCIVFS